MCWTAHVYAVPVSVLSLLHTYYVFNVVMHLLGLKDLVVSAFINPHNSREDAKAGNAHVAARRATVKETSRL